jgi:hypothetical protein
MNRRNPCHGPVRQALGVLLSMWVVALGAGRSVASPAAGAPTVGADEPAQARELTFTLEEVSAFDLIGRAGEFTRGQRAVCEEKPDANVVAYPSFVSQQPLYGSVDFAAPTARADPATVYRFALDESGGTGKGYDRLYFDLNRDRDLRNDGVVESQKSPPAGALEPYPNIKQQACFANLAVPLPFGSEGQRPLELMPRLIVTNEGYKPLMFVTTKARRGQIELGGKRYEVLLGHNYIAAGWFDQPWTALRLLPSGNQSPPEWWGADRLMAMHQIGDTLYTFSATPAGDKLFVWPYAGPWGVFEVGAGGRSIERMEMRGSVQSPTAAVAVGQASDDRWPTFARQCRLPVGDYQPNLMTVQFGKLSLEISNNYHSDGKPRDAQNRPPVYGITVRADKPFVLDFSNKPAVLFASPARNYRIKTGEELLVKAVLIDPVLDTMIRGLEDTTRKHRETGPDGQPRSYETNVSLDPNVVITRAGGEIVARGVMPFG